MAECLLGVFLRFFEERTEHNVLAFLLVIRLR